MHFADPRSYFQNGLHAKTRFYFHATSIALHYINQTGKHRSKYKAIKNVDFEPPIATRDNFHEADPEFGIHDHQ
jgi:hypothetical protein